MLSGISNSKWKMPKNLVNAVWNSKLGWEFCQLRPMFPDKPLLKHHVTLCKSCRCYFNLQLSFLEILKSSWIFQRNDDPNNWFSNAPRTGPALQSAPTPTSTRQAVHAAPYPDVSMEWVHVKHLADPMPHHAAPACQVTTTRPVSALGAAAAWQLAGPVGPAHGWTPSGATTRSPPLLDGRRVEQSTAWPQFRSAARHNRAPPPSSLSHSSPTSSSRPHTFSTLHWSSPCTASLLQTPWPSTVRTEAGVPPCSAAVHWQHLLRPFKPPETNPGWARTLPLPFPGQARPSCWWFKTVHKFTASLRVTWCLFHEGGSSLDLSIQGSEANS
jgi:hypothetical protein